ncbi:MAG: DUF554 domain-containing protein [Bacteroidales bacterium]|nr:DUF554 domain-containing protein [Bacteroidales bacterium]MCF8388981.1 DUF554 domain-containing protein [Bacteroidales bacterium]MCF8398644.1 DUF554 domain-containing protein [Bacteroidales bacterium]
MTGTIVNVIAIITGTIVGLFLNKRLPQRFIIIVFQAIGLFTLFLGVSMALETSHVFLLILSLILGSITGELIGLEKYMNRFSEYLKRRFKLGGNEKFSEGMITAFLLYCMGSVTIIGAIDEGLRNDPNLLLIKSMMDGVSSIALASTMGIGVAFSVIPLFLYQGGITLFAASIGEYFEDVIVSELTAVGGILLIGLGINILEIKKLKILNMIPALLFVVVLVYLFG